MEGYDDATVYIDWDFRPYDIVRPYNPKTRHYLRENVFVRRWQKLMTRHALGEVKERAIMREDQWFVDNEGRRYPVLKIFDSYIPSAHDTRIASNFILYLGRGNGSSFLSDAQKLSDVFAQAQSTLYEKADAYLAQWALENNKMRKFMQGGASTRFGLAHSNQGDLFYEPRYDDLKTLERMAYWCGTDDGQRFIQKCERLIRVLHKRYYPPESAQRLERKQAIARHLHITL